MKFTVILLKTLEGAAAGFLLAAFGAVPLIVIDPAKFNITDGWKNLACAMLVYGTLGAAAFMAKSPLAKWYRKLLADSERSAEPATVVPPAVPVSAPTPAGALERPSASCRIPNEPNPFDEERQP